LPEHQIDNPWLRFTFVVVVAFVVVAVEVAIVSRIYASQKLSDAMQSAAVVHVAVPHLHGYSALALDPSTTEQSDSAFVVVVVGVVGVVWCVCAWTVA